MWKFESKELCESLRFHRKCTRGRESYETLCAARCRCGGGAAVRGRLGIAFP